jgi:hypothetical protein
MTHLDGRTIPLSRKGTTQPNEVEVIEGEGVSLLSFTFGILSRLLLPVIFIILAVLLPSERDRSGTGGAGEEWYPDRANEIDAIIPRCSPRRHVHRIQRSPSNNDNGRYTKK